MVDKKKYKEVTGFDTPAELHAYELGGANAQQVLYNFIERWDGDTKSIFGTLLKVKFEELQGRLEAQKPYWVSVDERLPDPCSEVIVYLTNGEGVFVAYFDGDRKFYNEKQDRLISPTHWQYLPQPPVSLNNIKE